MKSLRLDVAGISVESFDTDAVGGIPALDGENQGSILCSAACGSAEICQVTSGSKC